MKKTWFAIAMAALLLLASACGTPKDSQNTDTDVTQNLAEVTGGVMGEEGYAQFEGEGYTLWYPETFENMPDDTFPFRIVDRESYTNLSVTATPYNETNTKEAMWNASEDEFKAFIEKGYEAAGYSAEIESIEKELINGIDAYEIHLVFLDRPVSQAMYFGENEYYTVTYTEYENTAPEVTVAMQSSVYSLELN